MNADNLPPLEVLLVEDDSGVRNVLSKAIRTYRANVTVAVDGQDGVEKYGARMQSGTNFFDVVITEIALPRLSGNEVLRRIREYTHQPLVYVMYDDSDTLTQINELNPDGLFEKPFGIEKIREALKEADQRRAQANQS